MQDYTRQADDGPDAARITGRQLRVYCTVDCQDAPVRCLLCADARGFLHQILRIAALTLWWPQRETRSCDACNTRSTEGNASDVPVSSHRLCLLLVTRGRINNPLQWLVVRESQHIGKKWRRQTLDHIGARSRRYGDWENARVLQIQWPAGRGSRYDIERGAGYAGPFSRLSRSALVYKVCGKYVHQVRTRFYGSHGLDTL